MGVPSASDPARERRRERLLGGLVLVLGFLITTLGSALTGPTFDEERRVGAVRHATDLARAFTQFGPGTLVSSSARGVYDDLAPFGVLPGLLSGWLGEVLSQAHVLDPLTGTRFGYLLVTGLAPYAVYVIGKASRGSRVGLLAAAILLGTPRFFHAASAAREAALVASLWVILVAAHLAALPGREGGRRAPFRSAQVMFAVALGLAIAVNLATLFILPVLVLQYFVVHRRTLLPALRRGAAPLPSSFLLALVLSPAVLFLAQPRLYRGGAVAAADWLFAPLAPTIEPVVYGSAAVTAQDVPAAYAVHFLAVTTPVSILLLAVGGAVVLARDAWRRRGSDRRDPAALGFLCACVVGGVLLGALVSPRVFVRFPPRVEAALPFVALAAAVALERLATRVVGTRRAGGTVVACALLAAGFGLRGIPTASASFNLLTRGPRGAIESKIWSIGDGSEVAPLAGALDALGQGSIPPPGGDVPRAYWSLLSQVGRLRARVESRGTSLFTAARGRHAGAVAAVERDGAVLWTLSRH